MMRFKNMVCYHLCILLAVLCFLTNNPQAIAARVAGEEGVTSVTPATEEKIRTPPKPVKRQPPAARPNKGKTAATEPSNNEEQPAQEKETLQDKPEKRYVTIDFDNVDIAIFIKFISELTGKNFVIDKAVQGKVTVISPTKISVEEAYKVFESVLEVHDYAVVPAGNIIKIVPAAAAKAKNIETRLKKQAISPEDKVVTQLIPLRYADPTELQKLFIPLVSKNSLIVPYAPTGTLIVTDVLSNIKRLLKIIDEIDVEGIGAVISVVPLEHATASILAKSLVTLFQTKPMIVAGKKGPAAGTTVIVTADERTNSLIIMASEDDTRKVKQLIALLDAEIPRGEGDIHVYYLQNANAEDLAAVLKAIPKDQKEAEQKGKAPVISKDVEIVADKATNSLVITANKSDYLILETVIKKLDIVRRMVYIEALFMEVTVDEDFNLGVQWQAGKDIGSWNDTADVGAFVSSTKSGGALLSSPQSLPQGLALGILGEGITVGSGDSAITFPSISALVNAYQGDSNINILSTPQLMTTDNEEAEVVVAENIPYLTRQDTSADAERDYSNYDYKDVGVNLKITPQINQERFVRLKIHQEVSQLAEGSEVDKPTTLKRQADTTVVIKDGHTVVIAGLIGETLDKSRYRVPCLGNIPGLGWLFKSISSYQRQTNLFIFITPHIVENPVEAAELYEQKKEQINSVKEGAVKMYEKPGSDSMKNEPDEQNVQD